ncbi:MAG TPA: class I SAM-dependent methyltransferase [Bryobacteraceae bacterium]|nr:class I SAM-dependent methyltransferase [Bryobacteraceae bacterium]
MDAGTRMLVQMAGARRFNRWMADTIAPFVGGIVLEAGAGIGNLTEFLFRPGTPYVALELEEDHLQLIRERFGQQTGLTIAKCDLLEPLDLRPYRNAMDAIVCLNVLEHIYDDMSVLHNLRSCLSHNGRAIFLVPQGPAAYGSLDHVLEHCRRYSEYEFEGKLQCAGFRVQQMIPFNRATYPGWILNSRILKRKTLSSTQLRLFDATVPLWRGLDHLLPWPPTSLIAVCEAQDQRETTRAR